MKKSLYIYKYDKSYKYQFQKFSFLECQKNLKKIHSKKNVRYYQEIKQDDDLNLYPLIKCSYANKILKRLHTMDTGNDGFVCCDDYEKINQYNIYELVNDSSLQIFLNISILGIFYDDDWRAIISIPDENIRKKFFNIVYKKFNVVEIDDVNLFYK